MKVQHSSLKLPTISICTLVGNEDNQIDDFITVLEGFADEIVFVVSPTSSPVTLDIIERHKQKSIISIEVQLNVAGPHMHFGKARNISLQKASKDYIICLDVDERLGTTFKEQIRGFLAEKKPPVARIVRVDDLLPHFIEQIDRIIKNDKTIWYGTDQSSSVHEFPVHSHPLVVFPYPLWHSQKAGHWLHGPQRILPSIGHDVFRTPKTKSFFGHVLRAAWVFQFKFRKVYFGQGVRRDGSAGLKFAFMRGLHSSLIQLLVGLKPAPGYEYWKDPAYEDRLRAVQDSIADSFSRK